MIFIHGGGFRSGGASESWYDADVLAKEGDIIVVTVNYRVGPLGGLYLKGISNGNLAVRDLIAASRWVKENIDRFGGDPSNITISGQSVGAWYAQLLSSMETTKGWFKRSILFSPPASIQPGNKDEIIKLHERYFKILSQVLSKDGTILKSPDEIKHIATHYLISAENILMKEMEMLILATFQYHLLLSLKRDLLAKVSLIFVMLLRPMLNKSCWVLLQKRCRHF